MEQSYIVISENLDWATGSDSNIALQTLIANTHKEPQRYLLYHVLGDSGPLLSNRNTVLHKPGSTLTKLGIYVKTQNGYERTPEQ